MGTPSGGYYNAAGQKVPSVTTVIGRFKDSGGLIKWAYRQGTEHENLRGRGLPAPANLYDVVQVAATAGSIAHDLIEQHIITGEVQVEVLDGWKSADEKTQDKARNCYRQYQRWRKQTNITIDRTETGGVSELYQYGGTFDGLGRNAEGELVLIDWKTSNAVYGDYLIQLAAYDQINFEKTGERVKEFHLLRMAKLSADFAHHSWTDLSDGLRAFVLMRELYQLTYDLGKRA